MKFIQRLKADRRYRFRLFLIGITVVILLAMNNGKKEVSEAACDSKAIDCGLLDTISGCFEGSDANECVSIGCHVGVWTEGLGNDAKCFKEVPVGWVVQSKSHCSTKEGAIIDTGLLSNRIVCAVANEDPDQNCTGQLEITLAGFMDSIWPTNPLTCKQRFIGLAGGLAFVMLGML